MRNLLAVFTALLLAIGLSGCVVSSDIDFDDLRERIQARVDGIAAAESSELVVKPNGPVDSLLIQVKVNTASEVGQAELMAIVDELARGVLAETEGIDDGNVIIAAFNGTDFVDQSAGRPGRPDDAQPAARRPRVSGAARPGLRPACGRWPTWSAGSG